MRIPGLRFRAPTYPWCCWYTAGFGFTDPKREGVAQCIAEIMIYSNRLHILGASLCKPKDPKQARLGMLDGCGVVVGGDGGSGVGLWCCHRRRQSNWWFQCVKPKQH